MIFPRPAGRINERFPRMQIQLRYAVMAAIKVVRVIPDTYVEESSFCFLFLSLSLCRRRAIYDVMKIIETPSPLIVDQWCKNTSFFERSFQADYTSFASSLHLWNYHRNAIWEIFRTGPMVIVVSLHWISVTI